MFTNTFKNMIVPAVVSMSLILSGCKGETASKPAANDLLAKVLARGTIVVATDAAYPPQSELVAGAKRATDTKCAANEYTANEITGYDVATAIEVAKRLGVEACFLTPAWSGIISGNWNERWDISSGSMGITPDRLQVLYFTQPYSAGTTAMFVNKNNTSFKKLSDLSSKRIGACVGCTFEEYLKGTLSMPGSKIDFSVKNAEIIGYDSDITALADLGKGDGLILDGVVTDKVNGLKAIDSGVKIKQLGDPVFFSYASMATDKKGNLDAVNLTIKVSEILKQMIADGTLMKISEQYYDGVDYATAAANFDIKSLNQFP